MKRVGATAAVLALTLTFVAPNQARASAEPMSEAQTVATTRANAVKSGDRASFLATVDPEATPAFKDAQALLFDGLRSLPFSKYEVTLTTEDSGNLAPGLELSAKYKTDDVLLPETKVTYRFGTYDDRDAIDHYWYTYVKRSGHWYVAGDGDSAIIGLDSTPELWDRGALNVQSSPRILVITTQSNAARGTALLTTAKDALTLFDARWKQPWNGKVVVIDPGSQSEAGRLVSSIGNIGVFSAFTVYSPIQTPTWTTTAPRVLAQDANLATESTGLQRDTLVHEFTHYAEADLVGPFTPTWAHEGTAEWVRLGEPAAINPVIAKPTLPTPTDFSAGTPVQIGQAYRSASSAMAFVESLKGSQAPVDLFQVIGKRRLNIGSPAYNVDQALQEATGLNTEQFTTAWDARYPTATGGSTGLSPAR